MSRAPRVGSIDITEPGSTPEIHAASPEGSGYHTFCGLDLEDPETTGLEQSPASPTAKITCDTCHTLITAALKYSLSDFYQK